MDVQHLQDIIWQYFTATLDRWCHIFPFVIENIVSPCVVLSFYLKNNHPNES